jgi:hypothetical protein
MTTFFYRFTKFWHEKTLYLLFSVISEDSIRKAQENWEFLEFNRKFQHLVCTME